MSIERNYSLLDQIIVRCQAGLETLFGHSAASRANPATEIAETPLSPEERKQSMGYMRVNHSGEVCAQALYYGQMMMARNPDVRQTLQTAAIEETDHLAWCQQRLRELGGHRSYLDPLWYGNAFAIGAFAGIIGDPWSLGFVEETEKQVETHLENHLHKLPNNDHKSRAIVTQMQQDEIRHGQNAKSAGAKKLPVAIKKLMQLHGKVMTTVAYWL